MKWVPSLMLLIPLLTVAGDQSAAETPPLPDPDFYTLENVCSTGPQYIFYPGQAYRSFIDKQYIHESLEDLLKAVSKLPAGAKIAYGCSAGTNQLASREQINRRLSALRAACLKAKVVIIAAP